MVLCTQILQNLGVIIKRFSKKSEKCNKTTYQGYLYIYVDMYICSNVHVFQTKNGITPYKMNGSNSTNQSFIDCMLQNEKKEVKY